MGKENWLDGHDLSGYYTSQQTDAAISTALASYYTKTQTDAAITAALNTALADYSTSQQMATAIATALVSYYTKTEVDTLDRQLHHEVGGRPGELLS